MTRGNWEPAPHLDLLTEKLLDVAERRTLRLLVQMPPRHGKSECTSANFPAWYVGRYPGRRVMLASYEHDFAATWGAKARDKFYEWGDQLWGFTVKKGKESADGWETTVGGGMVCAGVGGPLMGRGADLLIIDDPVKSAEEADSDSYRERAWNWYRGTAYTRLEPQGAVVLVMTRWHEDDLAGRILAEMRKGGDQWEVISLPAIAEEGDVLGRKVGSALWPERYPVQSLEAIQTSVGPYWWDALYQQRPSPPGGALFKEGWWHYYPYADLPEKFDTVVQSWDMAFKGGVKNDYVVGQVWGAKGARVFLLDQVRGRMDFAESVRIVEALSVKWPAAHWKFIEEAANGAAVISALQLKVRGVYGVRPEGGKRARANAVLPLVAAGNVWLPMPAEQPWVDEFVAECRRFPYGAHDDQVDAMTQGLKHFLGAHDVLPKEPVPTLSIEQRAMKEIARRVGQMQARRVGQPLVRPSL